jgi:hypothetical protein
VIEARFYDDDVGCFTCHGRDKRGRPTQVSAQKLVDLGSEEVLEDSGRLALVDLFETNLNV